MVLPFQITDTAHWVEHLKQLATVLDLALSLTLIMYRRSEETGNQAKQLHAVAAGA